MMYPVVLLVAKGFLKLFFGLKATGQEHFMKGPALICANHSSYLDPPIIACASPQEIHFLARDSLFKQPLFGWFIRQLNSHPVKPSNADVSAFKTVLSCLKRGEKVLIFPEGGRSLDGEIGPLKEGAAMLSIQGDAPIIPAYIEGAFQAWGRGKKPKLFNKVSASFGPPIYPSEFAHLPKKEAKEAITKRLEQEMLELERAGS